MSNFENSFEEVVGLEGGYVNDINDPGGETKWGIAKRWHPDLNIKNLTKEDASQIYWKEYWNPLLLSQVIDEEVATEIFEQAVNLGKPQAALHTQYSINLVDTASRIIEDGWMGPSTIKALNALGQRRKGPFLKCMNGFQFIKYLDIVKTRPDQMKFFVGWLKRVNYGGVPD